MHTGVEASFASYKDWGGYLLYAALFAGLSCLLYLVWEDASLIAFLPLIILAPIVVVFLFRRPLVNFGLILMGFVSLTDYTAGFQLPEIVYGLYTMLYLAHWFGTRLFLTRDRLITTTSDRILLFFLIVVALNIPTSFLYGATLAGVFREWMALMLLALYFPVKETIKEDRRGAAVVLAAILFIGLFVTLRNLINYREIVLGATQVWQVATNRISTNDNWLMISSLLSLILLLFARRWHHRLFMLGLFSLLMGGLIFAQSRGYWIAFAAGGFFMFLCIESAHKKKLVLLGLSSGAALLLLGLIFLQDFMILVFSGLLNRLFTLQDAVSSDISLINRFRETAAVWEYIRLNPILGHGMGVPFEFYDITTTVTQYSPFMHNGYVSLWFKFGVLGLGSFLLLWIRTTWHGLRAYRTREATASVRIAGLGAATILAAFSLSAITSNPFYLNDTLFAFGLLLGLASGTYERAKAEAR